MHRALYRQKIKYKLGWILLLQAGRNINYILFCGVKNIEEFLKSQKNKSLLVVFPHPDDESVMAGGLILVALRLGFKVTVLILTEGIRGKIHINGKGRSVNEIRREEMAKAMSKLGVADWIMWNFEDGKLKKTSNWKVRLRKILDETKPSLVVSYDLSGVTAHPDHIALSLEILRIYKTTAFFELLWVSFAERIKDLMVSEIVSKYLEAPQYELNLSFVVAVKKWRASFYHASQRLISYLKQPWWLLAVSRRTEWYSKAKRDKKYKYRFVSFKI